MRSRSGERIPHIVWPFPSPSVHIIFLLRLFRFSSLFVFSPFLKYGWSAYQNKFDFTFSVRHNFFWQNLKLQITQFLGGFFGSKYFVKNSMQNKILESFLPEYIISIFCENALLVLERRNCRYSLNRKKRFCFSSESTFQRLKFPYVLFFDAKIIKEWFQFSVYLWWSVPGGCNGNYSKISQSEGRQDWNRNSVTSPWSVHVLHNISSHVKN